jgi:hypothetical protein
MFVKRNVAGARMFVADEMYDKLMDNKSKSQIFSKEIENPQIDNYKGEITFDWGNHKWKVLVKEVV